MAFSGHISINIIIDENDELIDDVWVQSHGLPKNIHDEDLDIIIEETVKASLNLMDEKTLMEDGKLKKVIIKSCRGIVVELVDKKPEISVLINRLVSI
jgi:mRNA degradation ribonuclease J1/J2